MPTEATFLGGLIFGAIGLGALLFGKTTGSVIKMLLGAVLLACWPAGLLLPYHRGLAAVDERHRADAAADAVEGVESGCAEWCDE